MRIAFLDVGHGSAVVLSDGTEAVLLDAPPSPVVKQYLRTVGVQRLRHVVVSHADRDHVGGLVGLLQSGLVVDRVWIADDHGNDTVTYRDLLTSLRRARREGSAVTLDYPHSGAQPARFGEAARVEFLAPHREERMAGGDRNRLSVVARVVVGGRGVALVPGDLDEAGYLATADDGRDHRADWLVVPHHGGDGGGDEANRRLIEALLARTRADHAFISFSRTGAYRLPRKEVVAALTGRVQIRCSQLSEKCEPTETLAALGEEFQHFNSAGRRRGRGPCCAGTVELDLDAGAGWPLQEAHDRFVSTASQPLCRRPA